MLCKILARPISVCRFSISIAFEVIFLSSKEGLLSPGFLKKNNCFIGTLFSKTSVYVRGEPTIKNVKNNEKVQKKE